MHSFITSHPDATARNRMFIEFSRRFEETKNSVSVSGPTASKIIEPGKPGQKREDRLRT